MVQCKVKLLLDRVLFVPVNSSLYKSKQNGGNSSVEPCFVHSDLHGCLLCLDLYYVKLKMIACTS